MIQTSDSKSGRGGLFLAMAGNKKQIEEFRIKVEWGKTFKNNIYKMEQN